MDLRRVLIFPLPILIFLRWYAYTGTAISLRQDFGIRLDFHSWFSNNLDKCANEVATDVYCIQY